jgi:hypothetical protein
VLSTEFVPIDALNAIPLAAAHLLFLDAALGDMMKTAFAIGMK